MRLAKAKKVRTAADAGDPAVATTPKSTSLRSLGQCFLLAVLLGAVFFLDATRAVRGGIRVMALSKDQNPSLRIDGYDNAMARDDAKALQEFVLPISTDEECFPLSNYSQKVVRVDIGKFMEAGPGKDYMPLFGYMRNFSIQYDGFYRTEGQVFRKDPEIRLMQIRRYQKPKFNDCQLLYQHNYKAGGTTVILSKVLQWGCSPTYLHHVQRSQQLSREQLLSSNQNIASKQPLPKSRVTAFTFLRDPVSRFVSGVQQAVGMGASHNLCSAHVHPVPKGKNPVVQLINGEMHPTDFLQCVLDTMQHDINYLNIHLLPQAFMLYNQHHGRKVVVDLLDMRDIDTVLDGMGRPATVNATINKRDSKSPLANGTSLLTEAQIHTICRLYRLDLDLLHTAAGVTTTICDQHPYADKTDRWLPEQANNFFFQQMWSLPDPPDPIGAPKKKDIANVV